MFSEDDLAVARQSVLFANVPKQMMSELLKGSHRTQLARGATLFVQGDPAKNIYVVLSGCVKLVRITPGGEEIVVAVYTKGESFGEAVAFKGGAYPVTVEAVQDTQLLQVEVQVVYRTLNKDPELAMAMLASTFSHLHELVREIENLKALSGAQRLATFLIAQSQCEEGSCTFDLPYDKVLIAKQLGMKPESLSRSFANLRKIGVKVQRHTVAIEEMERLHDFVSDDG